MISISSSSFFLSEYLTEQLRNESYREGQLTFALKHNHVIALAIEEQASVIGSNQWLTLNRELAKSQISAALKLGHWYQRAAEHDLSPMLTDKAIMWFEQAIRLGSQKAHLFLGQLYYRHDQLVKAQVTLASLPNKLSSNDLTEAVLLLRLKILIDIGDIELAKELLNSNHFSHDNDEAQRFLMDIEKYSVIKTKQAFLSNKKNETNLNIANSSKCLTSLQLFATNLSHLKHIDQLIKDFTEQQKLAKYLCLPMPKYISIKTLECNADAKQAISCDESHWQGIAKEVNTRHIGLMLKEGGANVHLGILYFDMNDNSDVFSHEVSHLLGFVDEYPLIKDHDKCQGAQQDIFSHNIAVINSYYYGELEVVRENVLDNISWAKSIKASTPILQEIASGAGSKKHWRLGTPSEYQNEVGVYLSESCQSSMTIENATFTNAESAYSSFKPLNRHTQLRYFENEFPEEYLTILERRPSDFLMPSYHYNIALALSQQGNTSTVKYWIDQAAKWEDDSVRKSKVVKGKL